MRDALREKDKLSVRRAARLLHQFDDRQSEASWKRTLNRILDEDAERPYAPNDETAAVLSRFFGKPDDYFVRPQQRESLREAQDERDRLREEVAELRRLLAGEQAGGSSPSQS